MGDAVVPAAALPHEADEANGDEKARRVEKGVLTCGPWAMADGPHARQQEWTDGGWRLHASPFISNTAFHRDNDEAVLMLGLWLRIQINIDYI